MGLLTKIKESKHRRSQTRSSIFLANESEASHTSSDTFNYEPPQPIKNVPTALLPMRKQRQPRPKSDYVYEKSLPQEPIHNRSRSEDFNELPILSIGDETLQVPLNETKQNTDQHSQLDPALSKQSNAKLHKKSPSNDYDIRNGSQYKSNSKANESDYSKQTGIGDQAQLTEQDIQHEPTKSTFDYPNSQVTQPQAENLQPMHEQIEKLESKPLYEPVDQHNDSLDQQSLYVNQLFNHSQSQAVDQQQQQQHLYMQGMNTQRMSPRFSSNNNLFANENQTSEEFNVSQPNQFFNPYQMYQANSFYQPGPALTASYANDEDNADEQESNSSSNYETSSSEDLEEGEGDNDNGEDDEDEDEDDSVSSGSTAPVTQHPYYEQWRRYYEALAMQQQQIMNRQSMYGPNFQGFNPMMYFANPQMMQMQMQMPYFFNPMMMQGNNGSNLQLNPDSAAMFQQQMQQMQQMQQFLQLMQNLSNQPQSQPPQQYNNEQQPQSGSPYTPSNSNHASKRNSYINVNESQEKNSTKEPPKNDFLLSYKKSRNLNTETIDEDENELILQSRKSTVKSNRYPSAPIDTPTQERFSSSDRHSRVTSLQINFKPTGYGNYQDDEEEEEEEEFTGLSSRVLSKVRQGSLGGNIDSLAQLNLQDSNGALGRHISDYTKYLFDDEEEEDDDDSGSEEGNNRTVHLLAYGDNDRTLISAKGREADGYRHDTNPQLPTPNTDDGLSRQGTSASEASIQSGGSLKFTVADSKRRLNLPLKPVTNNKPKKKTKNAKKSKNTLEIQPPVGQEYNPNMSLPELSMGMMPFASSMAGLAPPPPPVFDGSPSVEPMMMNYSNPMLSQTTEYSGASTPSKRRQSVSTFDTRPRSMMVDTPTPKANKRSSVPVYTSQQKQQQLQLQLQLQQKIAPVAKTTTSTPVKVQDSTISKKIDEFVRLRSRIAAGNKTPEYRLHWVKMLIVATNYKLYSYINIKGEPIYQEQAVSNKAQFIKSSVTHILKLIKELSSGTYEADGVKCEAYFIYANLLKQDYLVSYNQDFNMEKNIDKAIDYYDRVLEINSKDFKALYKLGEIYEYEFDNEFNKAVEYYTAAAKFGYNRAILKMAMLYLQEPQMRSIKYMKYLKDLSNIDLNEVRLDEEDSSEMEEVIGLACYELGKIFEGIYPGDLTQDNEFIQKSLDMAPVNYAKSLTYYNKSAKLNCLLAQVRLGIVYERGELNRQRNPSKSIQWYIKASSSPLSFKRHPDAMVGLARWCLTGSEGASKHIPVPVPDRAVMWCKRAIDEFSSPDAMSFMGELCEMGLAKGRPQYWYEKAYKMGNREAGRKLGYSN